MINKLNIKDINQTFVNDIAFVFISHPGCLGPDGTVEFVLNNNDIYSCNVAYKEDDDYIDYDLLKNKLLAYDFDLDLTARIDGYEHIEMGGCGNYLAVKDSYALEFYRFVCGLRPSEIFQKWHEYASFILCTQKGTG